MALARSGFGGVQPTSPTSFGSTAGISIYDPSRRGGGGEPGSPWEEPQKGEPGWGGGTPSPTPGPAEPAPEEKPQTFFEKFPTPQEAWQDWIGRMGQFLARQPGETPNFPGPWGTPRTPQAPRVDPVAAGIKARDEQRRGAPIQEFNLIDDPYNLFGQGPIGGGRPNEPYQGLI